MLAVYGVDHSLPLGGTDRDFLFTEDVMHRNFSYLSGTFREPFLLLVLNFKPRLKMIITKPRKNWEFIMRDPVAR